MKFYLIEAFSPSAVSYSLRKAMGKYSVNHQLSNLYEGTSAVKFYILEAVDQKARRSRLLKVLQYAKRHREIHSQLTKQITGHNRKLPYSGRGFAAKFAARVDQIFRGEPSNTYEPASHLSSKERDDYEKQAAVHSRRYTLAANIVQSRTAKTQRSRGAAKMHARTMGDIARNIRLRKLGKPPIEVV